VAKKKTESAPSVTSAKQVDTLLDKVTQELLPANTYDGTGNKKLGNVPTGKTILAQDQATQTAILNTALDRLDELDSKLAAAHSPSEERKIERLRSVHLLVLEGLLLASPLSEATLIRVLEWPIRTEDFGYFLDAVAAMVVAVETFVKGNEIGASLRTAVEALSALLREDPDDRELVKIGNRLRKLLPGEAPAVLQAGEAWSDVALADLKNMKGAAEKSWNALLAHCQRGGKDKFTESWLKEARRLVDAVGFDTFKEHILRWFPLVDKPRTDSLDDRKSWMKAYVWRRHTGAIQEFQLFILPAHVEMLRRLAWCAGLREDADLARALTRLAISAYRKMPGVGPRLVSLGNACVTALGLMPGLPPIGQLAILKSKVKSGPAQKEIEKAFNAAAARENLPREEMEELAVPSYGLEEVGLRRETFDDYQADVTVEGTTATLHWLKEGKPSKSLPAEVKKDHAEDFKELQASVKDINAMLPAQRERLDTLYLARKTWPLPIWKERYLDHPLVGVIARRLIWSFAAKDKSTAGAWHEGQLVGSNGKALKLNDAMIVSLWHPIDRTVEEVLAWREWLEQREIVQPFKQAHREVYLLTDAERRTRTYSNRFAGHILRQHQFNALCGVRGWRNKLRVLAHEGEYPPAHRLLPAWRLRAEYWIEGVGDVFRRDTNDTGTFLYLSTDQVRFYETTDSRNADEASPLDKIPPLVFSEIMRDVDLFVGVASVGNDPEWSDGGPGGRHRDYWQRYSFGDLTATAQTRKALLERLLPRLKIADHCTLTDRFLKVRGSLRTYKIHLSSGNILMEPNDQYLCIVPKQTVASGERVFLPFEGDGTLSIVLSKAFLLADDAKITDPTIVSQLKS
jgi:hypothetical protein